MGIGNTESATIGFRVSGFELNLSRLARDLKSQTGQTKHSPKPPFQLSTQVAHTQSSSVEPSEANRSEKHKDGDLMAKAATSLDPVSFSWTAYRMGFDFA